MNTVVVTLHSICKHFFQTPALHNVCTRGVKHLLMVLLIVACSEAYCETIGSIIEKYHKSRYTNPGEKNDDTRMTKEVFIKMNGPPMIRAKPLIRKTVSLLSKNTRFATQSYLTTPGNVVISKSLKRALENTDSNITKRRKGLLEI